jgi:hypothetical protein
VTRPGTSYVFISQRALLNSAQPGSAARPGQGVCPLRGGVVLLPELKSALTISA